MGSKRIFGICRIISVVLLAAVLIGCFDSKKPSITQDGTGDGNTQGDVIGGDGTQGTTDGDVARLDIQPVEDMGSIDTMVLKDGENLDVPIGGDVPISGEDTGPTNDQVVTTDTAATDASGTDVPVTCLNDSACNGYRCVNGSCATECNPPDLYCALGFTCTQQNSTSCHYENYIF